MNPMQYHISEDAAKQINEIANKQGITIILDDLLRGNEPLGQRKSIYSFFSNPYLIEGLSHRYGEKPLGNFSYVLAPEGSTLNNDIKEVPHIFGELLHFAYIYSSKPIVDDLKLRNGGIDKAFERYFPEANIIRSSPSSITSLIELPKNYSLDTINDLYSQGVVIFPIEGFFPEGHKVPRFDKTLLRVAVGSMDAFDVYEGAVEMAQFLRENKN